jgi:hypothetical protein
MKNCDRDVCDRGANPVNLKSKSHLLFLQKESESNERVQ